MKLYRNTGKGTFADVTDEGRPRPVVPAMGANFGDLDNDGFLDFYLGTGAPSYAALMPNLMFRNHDGKYFVDVTSSTGTGHLQKGHGVAFADLDNDGDQDIYSEHRRRVLGRQVQQGALREPRPRQTLDLDQARRREEQPRRDRREDQADARGDGSGARSGIAR